MQKQMIATTIMAITAIPPIAMPAMAPPPRPLDFELLLLVPTKALLDPES